MSENISTPPPPFNRDIINRHGVKINVITDISKDALSTNVERKFLHERVEKTITIPKGNYMYDVKKLVLDSYNVGRTKQFKTVNKFYCDYGDSTQEIQTIEDLENCKNKITVYFDDKTIHNSGGGAYHNRRRSFYSRRRLSAKKRGTRRSKSNRRQRRGTRRSH